MKRKSKRLAIFPRKKSTQTPWKIHPLKEVDSLEESTREELSCSICMDYLSVPQATPCGHVFCYVCLYKWLEQESVCPQCRKDVDTAPYPVYLLSNQVDQALVKFPDPNTLTRIGKDLEYYKSFPAPWDSMFSCNSNFWDHTYSTSSSDYDQNEHFFYITNGFDQHTSANEENDDDSSDSDDSDENESPAQVVNSEADRNVNNPNSQNPNLVQDSDSDDSDSSQGPIEIRSRRPGPALRRRGQREFPRI